MRGRDSALPRQRRSHGPPEPRCARHGRGRRRHRKSDRARVGERRVVAADIDEKDGDETVRLIEREGGRAAFVRADVTVERDVCAMVRFAEQTFGGIAVLVNNAGGTPEPHFPEAPVEHWSRTLDLNLRTPMLAIQHSLAPMRSRGGGTVVNIASVAGLG